LAKWLHQLERDGVRLSLTPEGAIRLRGRLSADDLARLREDRGAITRLIRERQRRASAAVTPAALESEPQPQPTTPEPTTEPEQETTPEPGRIVGEQIVGWEAGRLVKRPIYACDDRDVPHVVEARRWLAEAVDESHGWQPTPGLYDIALSMERRR
jgi:hypothetical protein